MSDRTIEAGSAEFRAFDRSFATIAYALDGTILRVNANVLELFGYTAREIVGGHHATLVPTDELSSPAYDAFWAALRRGEPQSDTYRRVRKDGSDLWIRATYTPTIEPDGSISDIVAFATDVTAKRLKAAADQGQIEAIRASQAVIQFTLDGTIIDASGLFLEMLGYRLDEVLGHPHRMLVEPAHADTIDDAAFWTQLAEGRPQSGEYKRIGKDGREVWLRTTYQPIFDLDRRPFRVLSHAIDVTAEKQRQANQEGQLAAIRKSQAVITFNMDGTVVDANDLFLEAMGYRLDEVEGRHHRMFVDPSYAHGPEYAMFWSDLLEGRHQAAEYKRFGKNGREVWLQATYNPVFDMNGRPLRIVKYATVVTREKLRQADHQGQIASIHKSQSVVSFDMNGTILDANDNFLALTGYRLAQIRGRHHRMFVDDVTARSPDYAAFWSDLARGLHQAAEYKRVCRDGHEIWLQATYNPIFDMNGRPFKVVKYATDVTHERLRQADCEGQVAAIRKSQCVVAFDMDGIVIDANDNFLQAMGYRLDEIVGRHHCMFIEADLAGSDRYAKFWDTLRSGSFLSAKFRRRGKDDREVWIQASYNPILDLNGRPFKIIKIATDITADVALASDLSQARQQAEHDATTALPNRVRLSSFMASALAEPDGWLAILYLDLDHFKPINDTFGHHVGDHVLSETAARLREAVDQDQLVARIGGDEFVVAAPNLQNDGIEALCRRLISVVKAPIKYDKGTVAVGLSIGVAVSPSDAATPEELLRCADVALYRSKGSGRGAYSFYASDMNEQIAANRHLADDMLHGIKAGEFFLEYQPRFDASTRTLTSVEALVRWAHPERGRIEPADFIPLAETSGLIMPLGEWVLRTASQAATGWAGIGISVNVSPVQFRSIDLLETVGKILGEIGLPAQRLELEITEGTLLEDEVRARSVLKALKALGVRLAMDDFGECSSSLSHLRRFPFDVIKFDRRFIADIGEKDGRRAVMQAVQGLGTSLGVSSTATGIQTTGHLLLLSLSDSSEVQGFLLAEPMSAPEISALLVQETRPLAAAG